MADRTQIAIVGAGIFVKTQYIPRLSEISHLVSVKYIWSRSEETARSAVEIAEKSFPEVECKWGDSGFDDILHDSSIAGVAVVLAGQFQQGLHGNNLSLPYHRIRLRTFDPLSGLGESFFISIGVDMSLRLLKAGKHVIQEKPAAATNDEAQKALSDYNPICATTSFPPIWAVAENYRFEPGFIEGRKLVEDIGDMMSVQVIVEGSMNSSNPYFSSSWRRNFTGGFILDMGVHMIAGLRMLVGCEVTSVSALTSHIDTSLPPPDNISCTYRLENGCHGVFVMAVSTRAPKIFWRVVGLKGTVQVERGNLDGRHGYLISKIGADGQSTNSFYPFSGVTEELKMFLNDISKVSNNCKPDPRLSYVEGARDVAVLEAMLESGKMLGAVVPVQKF